MVFPESQRVVFARNPLAQVICQLRFPPILRIGRDPSDFQDRIRASYPLYEAAEPPPDMPAELKNMLLGSGLADIGQAATHQFISAERKDMMSLSTNFVAVSTENYQQWEDFRGQIKLAVDSVEAEYSPAFYDRIGLRYIDLVDRTVLGLADVSWSDLIKRDFLGPIASEQVGESVTAFQAQVVFSLDHDNAFVQLRYGLDGDHNIFRFDADFYLTGQVNGQLGFQTLDSFNAAAGNLFRWAIKPKLKEALGQKGN